MLSRPTNRGVKARGLLCQIDLNFIGLLVVFRKVLGDTKYLSDLLQSPNTDLLKAVDLIEDLRQTFDEERNDSEEKHFMSYGVLLLTYVKVQHPHQ